MVVNQQALATLNVGFSAAYNKAFKAVTPKYQKIATVVPSNTGEQKYAWIGHFPTMREWIGERTIQNLAAYDYSIKNKEFEMTLSVKRTDLEDDQYGVYAPMMEAMGASAAQHPDKLLFSAMAAGFKELCYDGKPFFSEQHKNGGYSYSNKGTEKLSAESYQAARSQMMSILSDKGTPLGIVPDLLVVPPVLEHTARLILKADQINGTTNVMKDTAEILVCPELAQDSKAWYLFATNLFLKPFVYQERKKYQFTSLVRPEDPNVFLKGEFLYGADGRSNVGYGFPQMAFGSTGQSEG